ncbi:hypothetical protein UlMin_003752 [Ulmus minor]
MCNSRALVLLLLFLHSVIALVSAQGSNSSSWRTLSGVAPLVIARGGFSGLLPDSSAGAYALALATSLPNVVLWCDVQLTKDQVGICFPDLKLDNNSDVTSVFKNREKTYTVNGVSYKGWFSSDFTFKELANVVLSQGIYSRTNKFDGNLFPILTVEEVAQLNRPAGYWLNIQHDAFYSERNLSMRSLVLSATKSVVVNYISSPEVAFLNSIKSRIPKITKLVFRFMGKDETDPSSKQTYDSLLKNLTFIKTFASGILVPKTYIWPLDAKNYLEPHTSLVSDAHKAGLEVYASDFVNDFPLSFNYSYDPVAEFLNYIDNGDFSVDGVLSDFPITASEAIDCFAHVGKNAKVQPTPLVISKNGASGDYAGCTDLAYRKAIEDKVDVLDCNVQISKDGIPFCLSNINLIDSTTVIRTSYGNRSTSAPEIRSGTGIYSFSLTWSEIQTLRPVLQSPYSPYTIFRNPKNLNLGKFVSLADFLDMSKNASSLTGVLIIIENAAYLAEKQKLSVTDAVADTLTKAGFDTLKTPQVMIQSTNSSVLMKFKGSKNYKLVYKIEELIGDINVGTVQDIKSFAHSVVVSKASVFPDTSLFLTGTTDVVSKFKSSKIPIYVELFSNEFVSQAWDFFSDATVEINSYVSGGNVDGIITDFPATAARYKRNKCLGLGQKTPSYMSPVEPGSLIQLITAPYLPPAEAPNPLLTEADVDEPPLPSVSSIPSSSPNATASAPTPHNRQPRNKAGYFLLSVAMLVATIVLF